MLDHEFKLVSHVRVGPLKNRWGWVFLAAQIGDIWFLRWAAPNGAQGLGIYSTAEETIAAIEAFNKKCSDQSIL